MWAFKITTLAGHWPVKYWGGGGKKEEKISTLLSKKIKKNECKKSKPNWVNQMNDHRHRYMYMYQAEKEKGLKSRLGWGSIQIYN